MNWLDMKEVAAALLLEKDALHIYAAFVIQVIAALLVRRPLSHWLPWLVVLGFALFNESLDMLLGEEASIKPWQMRGAAHDLVNTMLLPTVLLLLCRYRPGLFAAPDVPLGRQMEAECQPTA